MRSNPVRVVALLPWWTWVTVAIASFFFFKWFGFRPTAVSGPVKPLEIVTGSLMRAIALFSMFAVPALSLICAVASASIRGSARDRPLDPIEPVWGSGSNHIDTSRFTLELIRALEWKRLEELCAVYFRTLGFRAEMGVRGADGGVDIRLFGGQAQAPGILVQCKAWNSYKVGVKEIRELFGVMAADGVSEGVFVTTSTFTNEAIQFSRGKNIHLIDGAGLLQKLLDLGPEDQEHILRLTTADDFSTPTCPSCGIKTVRRTAGSTGESFWGCTNFPRCRFTLPLRRGS